MKLDHALDSLSTSGVRKHPPPRDSSTRNTSSLDITVTLDSDCHEPQPIKPLPLTLSELALAVCVGCYTGLANADSAVPEATPDFLETATLPSRQRSCFATLGKTTGLYEIYTQLMIADSRRHFPYSRSRDISPQTKTLDPVVHLSNPRSHGGSS